MIVNWLFSWISKLNSNSLIWSWHSNRSVLLQWSLRDPPISERLGKWREEKGRGGGVRWILILISGKCIDTSHTIVPIRSLVSLRVLPLSTLTSSARDPIRMSPLPLVERYGSHSFLSSTNLSHRLQIVYKAISPHIATDDPYSDEISSLLRVTNIRFNFTKLHTLGDDLLDYRYEERREEGNGLING